MCQNQCISHSPEWGIHTLEGKLPRLPAGAAQLPAGTTGEHEWVHGEGAELLGAVPTLPPPRSRLGSPCWGAAWGGQAVPHALCGLHGSCLLGTALSVDDGATANFEG